jgi:hypothetical protein
MIASCRFRLSIFQYLLAQLYRAIKGVGCTLAKPIPTQTTDGVAQFVMHPSRQFLLTMSIHVH